jgi:hypothetical protein
MINQVFNRVNDVRDLCEKRCEQLRQLSKPIYRPIQRVYPIPLPQNESIFQQMNEHFPSFDIDSNLSSSNNNTKMDKKQK